MSMPFDTLKFIKRLTKAGMPVEQAEALSSALLEALMPTESTDTDLATKIDLKQELKELESRLVIKLGGLIVAVAAAATAFDKLV